MALDGQHQMVRTIYILHFQFVSIRTIVKLQFQPLCVASVVAAAAVAAVGNDDFGTNSFERSFDAVVDANEPLTDTMNVAMKVLHGIVVDTFAVGDVVLAECHVASTDKSGISVW